MKQLFYLTLVTWFSVQESQSAFFDVTNSDNIAYYRPTRQAGDLDSNITSNKAVDYNIADTCANVDAGLIAVNVTETSRSTADAPAWWQVDLEDVFVVRTVIIVAEAPEDDEDLTSIVVTVGVDEERDSAPICATIINTFSLTYGVQHTLNCSISLPSMMASHPVGRYVTIRSNGKPHMRYLSICDVQVFGERYIELKDRAFERPARQFGTRKSNTPEKAVDSDPSTCSFVEAPEGSLAWWSVDLGHAFTVLRVDITVTDEDDACKFLQHFVVLVKNDNETATTDNYCLNYDQGSYLEPNQHSVQLVLHCVRPIVGRYLTIKRIGGEQTSRLALCDVKVYGKCVGERMQRS
jgi:hypothetical protein